METDDADFGGGIVEIKGTIRNCTNAVRFGRYRDGSEPNASKLSAAYLIINDNYRDPGGNKPVLLQLREINRLHIGSTWFYDLREQDCAGRDSRAHGLIADDASFKVQTSFFRHLDRGITAAPVLSGGYGSYEVQHSTFFNCYTGIFSALPDPFTIYDNTFLVGRPGDCPVEPAYKPITGVHAEGDAPPLGIDLTDNYFEGSDNDPQETAIGTDCFSIGAMENNIRKNNYEALSTGNRASGNNGGPQGLHYECNENNNAYADFEVTSGSSVRAVQGEKDNDLQITTAAGNTFSTSAYTWLNDGAPITYYYVDVPEQDPNENTGYGGATGIIAVFADQSNPNCTTGGEGCPPPCDTVEVESWKEEFYEEKIAWIQLYPAESGLRKSGSNWSIVGVTASHADNVRGISTFAKHFPPGIKELYQSETDSVTRMELLQEINAHRSAMDIEGGKIIRDFAPDSTGVRVDSVLVWLERLASYESDLRLARHAFFSGDFVVYDQWLTDIPVRNDLTEAQAEELSGFADMLDVVRPHAEAGTPYWRLPSIALDSLEYWASGCSEPGFIAKEILRRNGRDAFSNCGEAQEERPTSTQPEQTLTTGIRVYPNPSKESFFVEFPENVGPVRLTLQTIDGRIILQQLLPASSPVEASGYPPGIYLCRTVDATGLSSISKLVLSY
ncbi:MAG: T9SS type A sorting domain-containing protein [Saprospirales bacterium]|nr:T9SS type A sorting domain-containing protein [Saprospirales bacterium]